MVKEDQIRLKKILTRRLEAKGIERELLPSFVRILANSLLSDPQVDLLQVNKRLKYLGWDDFEMDYHTLQLVKACFDAVGLYRLEDISKYSTLLLTEANQ